MNTQRPPRRTPQTWLFSIGALALPLGDALAATAATTSPALLAAPECHPPILPAWSFEGILDSMAANLTGDRLVQVGVIGMCLALYFITRGKWK
ncbi:MAG TPA: hypothetical protein VKI65_05735 [Gemmataceae bacterium]|nr:hypothetical protein [Gemmataceae bacterium]